MLTYLPFYDKLTSNERSLLHSRSRVLYLKHDEQLMTASECIGMVSVLDGQLRAYISSDSGKEITLYRLLERDMCVLSASCVIKGLDLSINIMADKDSKVLLVPANIFESLVKSNPYVNAFSTEMLASRLSEVMWAMEQIAFKGLDSRLAHYLLEQASLEGNLLIKTTHEIIARDLGSAREVISRLLKYLENEGMVELSRNVIKIIDYKKLATLSE